MSRRPSKQLVNLSRRRPGMRMVLAATVCLCAFAGCGRVKESVTTSYGGRRGNAADSVGGLSVLAGMFENAGHRVSSRTNAASGIDELNVIIWAPDTFTPPTADERKLIEEWLSEKEGRTFVYIGRDYDAASAYWKFVRDQAKPADFAIAARNAALAEAVHDTARTSMPRKTDAKWFVAHRDRPRTRVATLAGDWSIDIDAAKANIMLQGQFDVPSKDEASGAESEASDEADAESDTDADQAGAEETAADEAEADEQLVEDDITAEEGDFEEEFGLYFDVLLAALPAGEVAEFDEDGKIVAGAPLVTRVSSATWGDSQLLIVTNGSFLLNLPLVNHEHRKLAGRLIEGCGEPGKVVIWESASFRATSGSEDEWSILKTWPLNFIMLHLAVLGMLYLLWRYPIFGLAHTLRPAPTSDFGKHIDALGKLTAATNDAGYAQRKLAEYRERVRRDAKEAAAATSGRG